MKKVLITLLALGSFSAFSNSQSLYNTEFKSEGNKYIKIYLENNKLSTSVEGKLGTGGIFWQPDTITSQATIDFVSSALTIKVIEKYTGFQEKYPYNILTLTCRYNPEFDGKGDIITFKKSQEIIDEGKGENESSYVFCPDTFDRVVDSSSPRILYIWSYKSLEDAINKLNLKVSAITSSEETQLRKTSNLTIMGKTLERYQRDENTWYLDGARGKVIYKYGVGVLISKD